MKLGEKPAKGTELDKTSEEVTQIQQQVTAFKCSIIIGCFLTLTFITKLHLFITISSFSTYFFIKLGSIA